MKRRSSSEEEINKFEEVGSCQKEATTELISLLCGGEGECDEEEVVEEIEEDEMELPIATEKQIKGAKGNGFFGIGVALKAILSVFGKQI